MKHWHHPQRLTFGAVLIALILATAALAQTGQISQVENRVVQKRMMAMNLANTALGTLTDMMGGRAFFDEARARGARRSLISATGDITPTFRKRRSDPLSHARPEIWRHWRDFKGRAKTAQQAARRLDTDSLSDLRRTLPSLISACLDCHRAYRSPM
ncbi:cytochrome c [Rhodobacteraceae bacterium F11138]|nr:cytochrome c [Rhodobacteraceae bacterium F11138]